MSDATNIARMARIDVACNDPESGAFIGRAPMLSISVGRDGDLIEFEARDWSRGPKFREDAQIRRFWLAGKAWPFSAVKAMYGNWCWNAYWLGLDDGIAFLEWLHRRRLYDLTSGPTEIHERWADAGPISREVLRGALDGVQHDGMPATAEGGEHG